MFYEPKLSEVTNESKNVSMKFLLRTTLPWRRDNNSTLALPLHQPRPAPLPPSQPAAPRLCWHGGLCCVPCLRRPSSAITTPPRLLHGVEERQCCCKCFYPSRSSSASRRYLDIFLMREILLPSQFYKVVSQVDVLLSYFCTGWHVLEVIYIHQAFHEQVK